MSYIETILERIRIKCFQILIGKENVKVWDEVMTRFVTSLDPHRFAARDEHSDLGIGYESMLNPQNMFLENYCRIQDHLNFISYKGKLKVRKYAAIGSGCIIIPGDHVPTVGVPQYLAGKLHINDVDGEIEVGEDAWVGAGSILLSHCKIGRGAVVAAGAVVSKEVPPYAVVAGIPAKIIATRFSVEQILKHESILYPPEERMTKEDLEQLFEEYYQGKRSIGKSEMSEEDQQKLSMVKEELGIPRYNS